MNQDPLSIFEDGVLGAAGFDDLDRDVLHLNDIELTIVGAGREVITELERVSGDGPSSIEMSARYTTRPKEAAYRITKPDGEIVASGSFEYG